MPSKPNNYTDPELRDKVKNEVQQGDKGGKPGQWSARKAQMTASEYKARGGDYTTSKDEKKPQQKNLDNWTGEEWQTKEGSGNAKEEDGTEKRYLPKKAWENMTEEEKEATEKKKKEGSKGGKQFVGNTAPAKRKRKEVSHGEKDQKGKGKGKEGEDKEDSEDEVDEEDQEDVDGEQNGEDGDDDDIDEEDDEEFEEVADGEEEEGDEGEKDGAEAEQPKGKGDEAGETETPEGDQPEKKRRKQD
ncbi:hypothetical protein BJX99DRAFT_228725 [Aspergillus californicus]